MSAAAETATELLRVACPACLAVNRVPRARLADAPRCGKCGAGLLDGQPMALDEANFERVIGRTDLPVVVDFWAPWCAPCRAMAPAFERVAGEHAAKALFVKVNTDQAQALAARFAIRSIPTLVLLQNGREIERRTGALDARSLRQWLAPHI